MVVFFVVCDVFLGKKRSCLGFGEQLIQIRTKE